MAYNCIMLRVGEIFLKGRNRNHFEKKLIENIKSIAGIKVKKLRFRYITDYFEDHGKLKAVFGLTSYSPALRVEKELEEIKEAALEVLKDKINRVKKLKEVREVKETEKKTFQIEAHRADKTFPLKSPEINREVGKFIEGNSRMEFDFNAKQVLTIEINNEGAYLFLESINCFSGLPVGVSGKVLLLVDDKKSLLAGILMMKRGCNIFPVALKNIALEKKDLTLLQKFSPARLKLKVVKDFSEIGAFAEENEIGALVVGDNFKRGEFHHSIEGWFASKPLIHLWNSCVLKIRLGGERSEHAIGLLTDGPPSPILTEYKISKTNLIILKPLIGYSDEEIEKELRKFI